MDASTKLILCQRVKVVLSLHTAVHTANTDASSTCYTQRKVRERETACAMYQNTVVKNAK